MSKVWFVVLERVTKFMVGSDLYSTTKRLVYSLMDSNMSGEEKRKRVHNAMLRIREGSKSFLINLAIEVAVAVLKGLK